MGQHGGCLGTELRKQSPGRLQARALPQWTPLWREPLRRHRRQLVGEGRREIVGGREAVLQLWQQLLHTGEDVRALHTGGVAQNQIHWMCPCRLQQRRRLHHLQLQPTGQLRRRAALLDRRELPPTPRMHVSIVTIY
ncbi:hypothetical protein PR202_ga28441 [Eleusine coracana subsp. coracana]|uniref:Uncharacterized protein n=1 Tax=Eleusine coracana subsp. coracana TaxID=191504 RepID=A0AAV5DIJ9_ELECO|nr:hypothetical protein PR202_ga28441 [Eleusine coracana subsp. coracana]